MIWLVIFTGSLSAQTITVDSTNIQEVKPEAEIIHSPKKAAIYSAVLPGMGQAYNKKYWKIPLIYVGFGTIGYFIGWNNRYYGTYKQAYSDLTDNDPNTDSYKDIKGSEFFDISNPTDSLNLKTGLSKQSDYYRRNRDLLVISMFAFYGLNIIDANVDAHLFDFEINDDLSMKWQPAVGILDKQLLYGFNCTFKF